MKIIDEELDWEKWGKIFQNIDYFSPIIEEIFKNNDLEKIECISNLTPGTNAVFKVNNYVLKIFVPDKVKPWKEDDFNNEIENIKRAIDIGINTPNLIAEGFIENKYIWKYLIFEYINAKEVKDEMKNFTINDKVLFAKEIRKIVDNFNVEPKKKYNNKHIKERVILGKRWNRAKTKVKIELENYLDNLKLTKNVYVHGDLTKENVMIDNEKNVYIIDFADSVIAPYYYEYPPIIFDLFDYDKVMIDSFFEGEDIKNIIEDIYNGILIHDFGGDFVKDMLIRYKNKNLEEMDNLEEIRDIIKDIIN